GSRIERLGARERLREEVRDSRERPLDTRLPASLREALGVAEAERGETGERLEQIEVIMVEWPPSAAALADAENAADLAAPDHRGDERVREAAVRIVRYLLLELVVGLDCDRTLPLHRERGNTAVGRKLEADQVLVEPVDGCTAQRATLGVEEIAVRSVDAEELRHFLDEPAQHDVEVELAADRLRGVEQRALLLDAPLRIPQQPRGLEGVRDLRLHPLDKEALA